MKTSLKNQIIYQVFPRQHSSESNFLGVVKDLDRIKDLGRCAWRMVDRHTDGEFRRMP